MELIFGLIAIYVMGFFTAIPVGATQIEIAKRSFAGHVGAALMIVLGSAISDVMYGFIAFFGIAPFLKEKIVMAIFWAAGSIILFLLGWHTLKNYRKTIQLDARNGVLKHRGFSLVVGFSLAVTNPMMIFWWLTVADIEERIGLIKHFTTNTHLLFLLFGGLGIASYLVTLSFILKWAKKFLSEKTERKINMGLGILLLILGFYFLFRFVQVYFL
ncbi:MAG: LysE family transporter [Bacteroidales bacterium]|nr:LysE family transporter [Bacteroidales bacterium]